MSSTLEIFSKTSIVLLTRKGEIYFYKVQSVSSFRTHQSEYTFRNREGFVNPDPQAGNYDTRLAESGLAKRVPDGTKRTACVLPRFTLFREVNCGDIERDAIRIGTHEEIGVSRNLLEVRLHSCPTATLNDVIVKRSDGSARPCP